MPPNLVVSLNLRARCQNLRNSLHTGDKSMQVRGSTLALKVRGDITRSPKQGYQWPHEKDLCPSKILKKRRVPEGETSEEVPSEGSEKVSSITPLDNPYSYKVPREPTYYRNSGWSRLAGHIMDYFLYREVPGLTFKEWVEIVLNAINLMDRNKGEWYFLKEEHPLEYTTYLAEVIDHVSGH